MISSRKKEKQENWPSKGQRSKRNLKANYTKGGFQSKIIRLRNRGIKLKLTNPPSKNTPNPQKSFAPLQPRR